MNASFKPLRKPLFWSILAGLSLASILFTAAYFSHNNPIMTLDISMDRTEALEKATQLQIKNNWLPQNSHSALVFENDQFLQYFIELECGGKDMYAKMMKDHLFEPYTWHVRHFQEKDTHEAHTFFTPAGSPYGFYLKLPETEVRENLTVEEARELAKTVALIEWNVPFENYEEIEASKDEKPCGRIDHTFMYQRTDLEVGSEGKYRTKLVVSGNLVTQVKRFIFVPEGFNRRYQELRSSNSTISTLGGLGFMLLYIFGGCLLAGAFFFRKKLVIIRPAFYWGACIGILAGIATLNYLPFSWMGYDTATSAFSFLTQNMLSALTSTGITTLFLVLAFSVALTWDRLAFPKHLQFWKSWSSTIGASREILGITLVGYAYAIIFLGLSTGIFMLLTDGFGWWSPAFTLTDPNILSCYIPFLSAFEASLQAGFMEEAIFRVIPIAAALIAGHYFKKAPLGLVIGFIIQAVIFSACHANYPMMPGYFRLVELMIPSILFGMLYVLYGLLPGLLAHYLYDLFLMELPIFAAHGTIATINKLCVVLLALAPLLVVLYRRYKRGSWYVLTTADYNDATLLESTEQSKAETLAESESSHHEIPRVEIPKTIKKAVYAAGIIGLMLLFFYAPRTSDSPALNVSQSKALIIAQVAFDALKLTPVQDMAWLPYMFTAYEATEQEKFVWQTQDKDRYHELTGSYLTPPSWAVRFASFTGPIIDRSEEFVALVDPSGKIFRSNLTIPENRAGESLVQGQARGIALQALEDHLGIMPNDIKEISATAQNRPERQDWIFTFQDIREKLVDDGQARINVNIAGDTVTNVTRFIFVPEKWQRDQQESDTYKQQIMFVLMMANAIILLLAFAYLQKTLFKNFLLKKTALIALPLVGLSILAAWNSLPLTIATIFSTTQSYGTQLLPLFIVPIIFSGLLMGLVAAYLAHFRNGITSMVRSAQSAFLLGICFQVFVQGVISLVAAFTPHAMPLIGDYSALATHSPFFALAYSSIIGRLSSICLSTVIILALVQFSKKTNLSLKKLVSVLLVIGFISYAIIFGAASYFGVMIIYGLVGAVIFTAAYLLLLRYDQTIQIVLVATAGICDLVLQSIWLCTPDALTYGLIVSAIAIGLTFWWITGLHKK